MFSEHCSVPGGVLKCTLDCVDGYHRVEVAEEDRDKMSFITKWGSFPIGECHNDLDHLEIVTEGEQTIFFQPCLTNPVMVDMKKIVDDILIWSESIEESFFRVCNVLSYAGRHGMVFCPRKFCFAREEVEFAGLLIYKDGIRPTEQYKQAILDFPVPKNIRCKILVWIDKSGGLLFHKEIADGSVQAPFEAIHKV